MKKKKLTTDKNTLLQARALGVAGKHAGSISTERLRKSIKREEKTY